MIANPGKDERYWSCRASMESDGYEVYGRAPPVEPWLGILVSLSPLLLRRFNKATGAIDEDSNATAIVTPEDLFLTEAEAVVDYREQCFRRAEALAAEAEEFRRRGEATMPRPTARRVVAASWNAVFVGGKLLAGRYWFEHRIVSDGYEFVVRLDSEQALLTFIREAELAAKESMCRDN